MSNNHVSIEMTSSTRSNYLLRSIMWSFLVRHPDLRVTMRHFSSFSLLLLSIFFKKKWHAVIISREIISRMYSLTFFVDNQKKSEGFLYRRIPSNMCQIIILDAPLHHASLIIEKFYKFCSKQLDIFLHISFILLGGHDIIYREFILECIGINWCKRNNRTVPLDENCRMNSKTKYRKMCFMINGKENNRRLEE